jgi:hypothetical protein
MFTLSLGGRGEGEGDYSNFFTPFPIKREGISFWGCNMFTLSPP